MCEELHHFCTRFCKQGHHVKARGFLDQRELIQISRRIATLVLLPDYPFMNSLKENVTGFFVIICFGVQVAWSSWVLLQCCCATHLGGCLQILLSRKCGDQCKTGQGSSPQTPQLLWSASRNKLVREHITARLVYVICPMGFWCVW